MKKSDFLSIAVTFAVGLFVGGYLYLTGAASYVTDMMVPDSEKISKFIIVGELYGSCYNSCPSFQVLNNGTYRYMYTPDVGADQVVRKGSLPGELHQALKVEITENRLLVQSQPRDYKECNSDTEGMDLEYRITVDGTEYILDSCKTKVDGQGEMWATLGQIWTYYKSLGNN